MSDEQKPTMQMEEDITKRNFHCPLCGTKSRVELETPLG